MMSKVVELAGGYKVIDTYREELSETNNVSKK